MVICVPEIFIEPVEEIDYVLIGCDGIWEEK
jgi:serine/threonine protein phosphatase PrpC